jgi:hypothetical protein
MTDGPLIYLALGFHDHQPVGNFPEVFEKHHREAYVPLLDAMDDHPSIPFSLHVTGPLLLWLCEQHPEHIARLRRLRASGRMEMKGGGFYEPILSAIPDDDKREQLRRMSCFLEEQLGAPPEGAWLAERVWEPHLARHLADAGLAYAALDDSHFLSSRLSPDDIFGYYVTEEEGRRFDLFPISKELRYLIPFQEPRATVDYLKRVADDWISRRRQGELPADAPPPLAVYDDDGEKFGGWPGTHDHVYREGWLDRFLGTLEEETRAGWLGLTTLGAYRRAHPPLGRIYVPTASYAEMLEWSNGFYRNFLVRYDEANLMHKRMLHTSLGVTRLFREHEAAEPSDSGSQEAQDTRRAEKRALLQARDGVLKAQCNDAYWHGVFGGIYLPHLRHAVYSSLIEAERAAGAPLRPPLEVVDVDLDGFDECFLRSDDLTVLVRPAVGGSIVCLDHLPTAFALLDCLRRRREPEHAALEQWAAVSHAQGTREDDRDPLAAAGHTQSIHDIVRMKEPGLERMLFVDGHPRAGFVDHFYATGCTTEDLVASRAADLGDFATGSYALTSTSDAARSPGLTLERRGSVAGRRVTIRKTFRLEDGAAGAPAADGVPGVGGAPEAGGNRGAGGAAGVELVYLIEVGASTEATGPGDGPPSTVLFAPEVNLTLLAGWAPDRYVRVDGVRPEASYLADEGTHLGASEVSLVDESLGLSVRLTWHTAGGRTGPQPTLLRHGVVTVSLSEEGYERVYQSTALYPCIPLELAPGTRLEIHFRIDVVGP